MKVLDQLIHFAGLKVMAPKEAKIKALELLKTWKMQHYAEAQASDLSKGNQQRIQFLACILHDPELIILDEPFSGLDPVQADWLKEQVMSFKQQGKIVLYSSHRMDSVEALCDRVLILHEGKKIAYGSTADLCKQDQEHWKIVLHGGDDEWMKDVAVLHVQKKAAHEQHVKLKIQESELGALMLSLKKSGAVLESMQRDRLSLHEVFVNLTSDRHVE
jgi:ABC-2 type transport system ATP-binding protein